jgi:hypothetical protein
VPSGSRVAGNTALAARPSTAGERDLTPSLSVVPAADAPSPRTPFVVLVLFLIGAGLVALLLLNTAVNQNAFRLHALETEKKALDLQQQQLERDLLELNGPGPLQAAANRLGLVSEGTPGYIQLPDGKIVGVPTPAKASPGQQPPAQQSGSSTLDSPPPAQGGSVKPGGESGAGTKPDATKPDSGKHDSGKPSSSTEAGGTANANTGQQPPGDGGGR